MSTLWRVHAVLGGTEALRPTEPACRPGLDLPHGTGTTRWISGGASAANGWPLRVENLLNGTVSSQLVLNLANSELSEHALFDELHPGFPDGFPRLARIAEEVRGRLADLGLRSELGWVGIFPSNPPPATAMRKICQIAARLGFTPLVAGMDPTSDVPSSPPRTSLEAEQVARRVAEIFAGSVDQPKAPSTSRANAGNSGSRAPIE